MRLIVCLIAKLTDWLTHKDLPAFWLAGGVCVLLVVPPASNVGHSLSTPARQFPEQRGAKGEFQKSSIWMFYNEMFSSNQHIYNPVSCRSSCWRFSVCSETWWSSVYSRVTGTSCDCWPASENQPFFPLFFPFCFLPEPFFPFFPFLLPSRTVLHNVKHIVLLWIKLPFRGLWSVKKKKKDFFFLIIPFSFLQYHCEHNSVSVACSP